MSCGQFSEVRYRWRLEWQPLFKLALRICARVLCCRKKTHTSGPLGHESANCSATHACVWISVFPFWRNLVAQVESLNWSGQTGSSPRLFFQALVPPTRCVYSFASCFLVGFVCGSTAARAAVLRVHIYKFRPRGRVSCLPLVVVFQPSGIT